MCPAEINSCVRIWRARPKFVCWSHSRITRGFIMVSKKKKKKSNSFNLVCNVMHYKMADSNRKEEMSICPNQPAWSPPSSSKHTQFHGRGFASFGNWKKNHPLYREKLCPAQRGLGAQPTAPEDLHSVGAGLGVWEGAQHSKSSALSRQARLAPWDKGSSVSTLSVGGRVLVSLDFSWAVHEGQLPLHVPPEQGRVGPPATCLCVLDNKLWNDFWFRILWSLSELTHSTNSA